MSQRTRMLIAGAVIVILIVVVFGVEFLRRRADLEEGSVG